MSMCIYHGNLALADAAYLAGLSDGEWALREAHYNKSQCLNQRGVAA